MRKRLHKPQSVAFSSPYFAPSLQPQICRENIEKCSESMLNSG
jgi:hypothetical protein